MRGGDESGRRSYFEATINDPGRERQMVRYNNKMEKKKLLGELITYMCGYDTRSRYSGNEKLMEWTA